jgi:PAS domain S-box-containing protein
MDIINIQYLLWSFNTGKIGQVNLNLSVWLKFLFYKMHPDIKWVLSMAEKPTYEELERRVQDLEKIESEFEVLKADKQRLEMILSSLDTGLSLINPDYTISWVNDTIRSIFPNGDPVGKTCHRFYESSEHMCNPCPTFEAYKSGQIQKIEKYNPSKDKFYSIISQPVKDEAGQIVSVLEGITEITERKNYEQQILKEKNLLQQVMETSPVGITMVDEKGNITMANARAEEILGLERSDIYKRRYNDQEWQIANVQGNEYPDDQLPFELVKKTGKSVFGIKHSLVWPDGKKVLLSINATPLLDRSGNFNGMVSALVDITERKQAEESLQESEARFRSIYENTAVGLAQVSLDFKIISANEAYCIMLGYEEKDLVGRHLKEITHPDVIEENIQKQANLASGKIDHYRMEKKFIHKNGKTVHAILDANLIRDPSGKAIYFLGSVVDITERKRAEMDLQSQKKLLKGVLDSIKDIIGVQLPDHTMVQYNRAGYELLGLTKDQVQGKKCYALLGRPHPCENCAASRAYISKELETIEKYIPELGRHFLCTSNPILDNNKNIKLVIQQLTDITEKKRIDEQLHQAQKMESVGRLAGGVAHDFNNMLGVILGHTELALLQADENHELHGDLKEIQKAAQRSADITKQLLAFARKQTISPRQLDLNDTVASMLNMLRRLIGEDIDLVWQPAANLWSVKMDPTQIDQILANLCVNARDAISGVGKLTIETGKKTFDEAYCNEHAGFIPGDFVLLAVSDNGCGMDKDTLDNLFEPFFTTKEVGKGTGLGLATIYGIVKQNNGFINVYSEPGQGSTFKIYLPRLVADKDIDKAVPEKKAAAGGTETILLVEDEPTILRMTRMMLERKGYSVLSAATPAEAIDLAKAHADKIHLLMTDVVMPEMNGRDLAGKITALYPDIGLLFMSGYTSNVIAHQGVLDDGVAFIQKPFSMADMTAKVRELLDKT